MATVWIPAQLRDLTNGQETVMVPGARVGQIIEALEQLFPGIQARLRGADSLRPGIAVVVDGEVARLGLLQPVGPASEVHFLPAIGGGQAKNCDTADSADYATFSLTARLAVALHCFAGYCRKHQLDHPAIAEFLEDLWEFPVICSEGFQAWESSHPILVHVAGGDAYPEWFELLLRTNGVSADEFRDLIANVVWIIFGSFYCAANNRESLQCLHQVLSIVGRHGVAPPTTKRFAASRFCDRQGWGERLTRSERDDWRAV